MEEVHKCHRSFKVSSKSIPCEFKTFNFSKRISTSVRMYSKEHKINFRILTFDNDKENKPDFSVKESRH